MDDGELSPPGWALRPAAAVFVRHRRSVPTIDLNLRGAAVMECRAGGLVGQRIQI
jgi:hypothetical protein